MGSAWKNRGADVDVPADGSEAPGFRSDHHLEGVGDQRPLLLEVEADLRQLFGRPYFIQQLGPSLDIDTLALIT